MVFLLLFPGVGTEAGSTVGMTIASAFGTATVAADDHLLCVELMHRIGMNFDLCSGKMFSVVNQFYRLNVS